LKAEGGHHLLTLEGNIRIYVNDDEYHLTIDGMGAMYDPIEGLGDTFEEAVADLLEQVRGL
jgi:hypothetical protein